MRFEAMPRIRIQLDSMKHEIINYLGLHNEELSKVMDRALTKAIDGIDIESEMKAEAEKVVREAISIAVSESFFDPVCEFLKEKMKHKRDKVIEDICTVLGEVKTSQGD